MPDHRRIAKIEKAIQQEIARALVTRLDDPRCKGIVTITRVVASPDLSATRVYFSVLGDDGQRRTVERFFKDSAGYFRTLVAKRLDGRSTPQLNFYYDESAEREQRVTSLLDQALAEDREAQAARGETRVPEESSIGKNVKKP
ncbi:MAG: 30S ribosome-binding factor RbfA [Planctomycetes bacterium]|nr:30S ribosome-binding factor RbfA [Planctomycetota bacterium]